MPSWLSGDWLEVMTTHGWMIWLVMLFFMGAAVGSFLNVCVARLPLEKSLLWPGSRCGQCFQSIRWYDNLPLVSYWLLRGRCRKCGARFSLQYFVVELLTGLGFAGLFYLEIVANVHGWRALAAKQHEILAGVVPWQGWLVYGLHGVLFSILMIAACCDFDQRAVPLSLTVTGTVIGLVAAIACPWPFPNSPTVAAVTPRPRAVLSPRSGPPVQERWYAPPQSTPPLTGLYPWPVRWPLPSWLPPGSWQLGLATGISGLLIGTLLVRAVRFIFSTGLGMEAMGLGDADLMMLAGSFLGWQPVIVAFFVSVFPALLIGLWQLVVRRDNTLPFVPGLALGVVVTWVFWERIAPHVQLIFFWDAALLVFAALSLLFMLAASLFLGRRRRQAGS